MSLIAAIRAKALGKESEEELTALSTVRIEVEQEFDT